MKAKIFNVIRGWLPVEPNLQNNQTKLAAKKQDVPILNINFRVRGFIMLITGVAIFSVGVLLYFLLNAEPAFLAVVLGFSIPFFFIGGLLLRAHLRVKKGQPPITGDFSFQKPPGAEKQR